LNELIVIYQTLEEAWYLKVCKTYFISKLIVLRIFRRLVADRHKNSPQRQINLTPIRV